MQHDKEYFLDTKGLLCPLPVLKTQKYLSSLPTGITLTIEADDPASVIDFPHFCNESGNHLIKQTQEGDTYIFHIRKK